MDNEKRKTPKLRFPQFTDPWEQRKLGELLKEYHEKCPKDGTFEHVSLTKDGVIPKSERYERDFLVTTEDKNYRVTHINDICYNPANLKFGVICRNKYKDAIFSPIYVTFKVCEETVLPEYIEYVVTNPAFIQVALRYQQGTVYERMAVSAEDLLSMDVDVPELKEQIMISNFITDIDNLITLHQRKLDNMKEYKKGMLQKMFPKDGETVPEIRFPGFTDPWEQRKLGEIVEKYEDPVETPHNGYERLGIRSHAKGTFHSYVEPGKELETAKMHRVAANKFILNITFAWEHAVAVTVEKDAGKLVSHRFPQFSFSDEIRPDFFKYVITDQKFREHLVLASPGGAGRNRVLKISDMLKYKICYPSLAEQNEIGLFFKNLDNLITLHQRKLDQMKEYKSGLLQQMFA